MRKTVPFLILILGVIGLILAEYVYKSWADSQTVSLPDISSLKFNIGVESEASMRKNGRW